MSILVRYQFWLHKHSRSDEMRYSNVLEYKSRKSSIKKGECIRTDRRLAKLLAETF